MCRWFHSVSILLQECFSSLYSNSAEELGRWRSVTEGAAPLTLMLDRLKELNSLRLFLFLCVDHNRKLALTGVTRERRAASPYVSVLRARERLMGILSLSCSLTPPAPPPSLPPSNTQLPSPILHRSALLTALLPPPPLPSCPDLLTHKLAAPPVNTESSRAVSSFIFTLHGQIIIQTPERFSHDEAL